MKKLKLFFALFAMLALGVGNAWAETVTWEKATSIAEGDVVLLVYESSSKELSGISTTSTKYGIGTAYTTNPAGLYPLNVEAGSTDGTFSFKNSEGEYLYWTSGNSLNVNATKNAKTSWTVSFSNEDATIANAHDATRTIRWNTGSPRFACYTSGQQAVQLYKQVVSTGSTEPVASVTLNPTEKDFGTVNVGDKPSQEFTITAENTTATLSAEISNTTDYAISDIADNKITVTYQPQTAGTHEATLTIKAGEEASTTVALTGKAKTPLEPIAGGVIDILNQDWTDVSGTNYKDVAEKTAENTGHSNAKYVAQCAGDKSSIQLRSNNSNSGVVSTISGGVVKRIEVEWHADTDAARTLQIYGSNTAYTAATDLYGDAKGELLGELNKGEGETTLDFSEWTGDYKYIGFRSKSGAMYLTTLTITWLPTISKVTIDDQIENGSVNVSGAADLNSVAAGTELTLSNTPATNYKLTAYDVYKTDDATTKVTVNGNTFVMPEFDVTISATFVPAKTLTSIEITTAATQTTFWQGETFNHNGLKVTAHFDGAEDEDVTDKVTVTGSTATAGAAVEVTVSFTEGTTTETTEYDITVKATANTKETAYDVTTAREIIDKVSTADNVYVTGIVSQIVTPYNSEYGNITYNISADGTTNADQLQAYRGKSYNGANFTSADDVKVGDEVVIKGTLKKYSTTYEFDENNQLVSLNRTKEQAGLAYEETELTANVGEEFTEPTLTNPNSLSITYSSSNTTLATVNATTGEVTILAAGKVTITASTTGNASYAAGSASYNITISNPAMAVATLPFTFNSGKADIENTAGMTQEGLGSDYSASTAPNSQLKFGDTGVWVVIRFDSEPEKLSYDIKNNSFSGGTFSVQESADGETYTDVKVHTEITGTQSEEHTLSSASRYVKFIYTEKVDGNVGLGNIKITKFGEEPEQPGGGETPEERLTDWVLTSATDITINDLVVITMTKGETTWAMSNDNGTSAAPAAPVVTLSADALAAEPAENLKWVVSNDNGTLTIYPYGGYEKWLYSTTSNNGIRVGISENKTFKIDDTYGYLYNIATGRYVGVYNNEDWRSYTSMHANISDQTLKFFVKKDANDILPGTGEDPEEPGDDPVVPTPTINPTATFIFNTAEGLNDLGITYPVTPTTTVEDGTEDAFKTEFENNAKFTQDGITMTTTNGGTPTRVWLTAAGKLDLRVYKDATLTFSVPAEHQISKIVFDGSNIGHLLVNGNAVSGNAWTGSAQTITFTAKDDAKTIKINTIAFVVEYTRDVTNTYGTICLPHASASTSGAYFYEVVGKGTENSKPAVYLASVNTLKAGVPYIFEKTANTIKVVYSSEKEDTPQNANGLIGNFTNEYVVPANNYILYNNAFIPADGTTNKVNAYRAYLDLSAVEGDKPNQMPGRRYIGMNVQGENETTGFEDIFTTEAPVKVIENGQLIIIRDGVKYNVQGVRL